MKTANVFKTKKIWCLLSVLLFAITVCLEILRQTVPPYATMPTRTEGIITVFRNIALVFFALSFTVLLFLMLAKRFGKAKAVFYTLYSDCFMGFLTGVLITALAGSQDPSAFGMTPIESIYYYFIGLLVMAVSVSLSIIGMLAYAVFKTIIARKLKKHQKVI